MRVKGLDNREYPFTPKSKSKNKESSGHSIARELLKELYPNYSILEEIELPGTKLDMKKNLYADFYIPGMKLIIEIHGRQHYEFTPFFHKNIYDFYNSKKRDRRKIDWCDINGITYIELPDSESKDEWRRRIGNAG